jgi:dTDP-L-rhamnose 4-epimerase
LLTANTEFFFSSLDKKTLNTGQHMSKMVLITGGAGFIGSHLADALLQNSYNVRILDNLSSQVHGINASKPSYLNKDVQFILGDVCDPDAVSRALRGVNAVVHLAASVGVGQSMYQIEKYTRTNNLGTATLLEQSIEYNIERLIIASSMSVYGEGLYISNSGHQYHNTCRTREQLTSRQWDPLSPTGEPLKPIPTTEEKPPMVSSLYALSKYDQERMCFIIGNAYHIPVVALRLFNVYGIRQALSNPYTGVLAIFASRYLNNQGPVLFEDGFQQRDFVSVYDVCRAFILALKKDDAPGNIFNIGSGTAHSLRSITVHMSKSLCKEHISPIISGTYRSGDVRHCFADISHAREILGYEPEVTLQNGIFELTEWLLTQTSSDRVDIATSELVQRGLAL